MSNMLKYYRVGVKVIHNVAFNLIRIISNKSKSIVLLRFAYLAKYDDYSVCMTNCVNPVFCQTRLHVVDCVYQQPWLILVYN